MFLCYTRFTLTFSKLIMKSLSALLKTQSKDVSIIDNVDIATADSKDKTSFVLHLLIRLERIKEIKPITAQGSIILLT